MDTRTWHYIKPNETTKVPRRLIFLDTESHQQRSALGHVQTWALAVACYRSQRPDRKPVEQWETYDDPEILWKAVDAWVGSSGRTVLWTHNLGYDARIAEVFEILPALGFELVAHNLVGKGTWLMWRRGRASLTMVDSASVFPCELVRLGVYAGLPKLPLPPSSAAGVGLYSRCWRDVEILRHSVLEYLHWLETEDLGNWQLTGAGQSWATFRHRFMDRRLLVHDDQAAIEAERRAMWTGRCEAYWHGEIAYQVVHEWDLTLAYARIAQTINVPVRLVGPMPDDYDWRKVLGSERTALLAECEITTEVPVVPASVDGRIIWPVGTFTTTLWDVEIAEAIDAGATVTVHKGWLYYKAPALKKWADWLIEQLDNLKDMTDHWLYIVLKHWARALIGRFAMTYTKWEEYAYAPTPAVRAHPVYDGDTGETFRVVQIGRTMWRDVGIREWSESMPMVTGYIQAACRVRLWRIIAGSPTGSVLYADTDSVLVADMHSSALSTLAAAHPEWGLRLKRSWQGFAVWGPRQIRTGPSVRISGVARHAVRSGPMTFEGQVWETLDGAIKRGHSSTVEVRDRTWLIKGVDYRRHGTGFGWTHPHRLPRSGEPIQPTYTGRHHDSPGDLPAAAPTPAGDGVRPAAHTRGGADPGRVAPDDAGTVPDAHGRRGAHTSTMDSDRPGQRTRAPRSGRKRGAATPSTDPGLHPAR
jgi:hypothetical protein